jgi:hypothetical protein
MEPVEIERVNIREVWPGEARDFTPWMADNLDVLGDHLEFGDLELDAIEVPIPGGRNLDLLATDADGRRWAIENQYGIGDHDHLTRGLAYAVALDCHALVVIAEGHRDEFIAVVAEWNRYSEAFGPEGIRVFLAVIEAWTIGESAPGFRFRLVEGPNEWKAAARSSAATSEATSNRREAMHGFWSEFLPVLSEKSRLFAFTKPRTGPWIQISNGPFKYQVWVKADSCHVQLRIDGGDGDENESLFDELLAHQSSVDEEFGPGLEWNRSVNHRACFVRFDVVESGGWKTPTDVRSNGHRVLSDALIRFHGALDRYVSELAG